MSCLTWHCHESVNRTNPTGALPSQYHEGCLMVQNAGYLPAEVVEWGPAGEPPLSQARWGKRMSGKLGLDWTVGLTVTDSTRDYAGKAKTRCTAASKKWTCNDGTTRRPARDLPVSQAPSLCASPWTGSLFGDSGAQPAWRARAPLICAETALG